jgi:hypothetical protein
VFSAAAGQSTALGPQNTQFFVIFSKVSVKALLLDINDNNRCILIELIYSGYASSGSVIYVASLQNRDNNPAD